MLQKTSSPSPLVNTSDSGRFDPARVQSTTAGVPLSVPSDRTFSIQESPPDVQCSQSSLLSALVRRPRRSSCRRWTTPPGRPERTARWRPGSSPSSPRRGPGTRAGRASSCTACRRGRSRRPAGGRRASRSRPAPTRRQRRPAPRGRPSRASRCRTPRSARRPSRPARPRGRGGRRRLRDRDGGVGVGLPDGREHAVALTVVGVDAVDRRLRVLWRAATDRGDHVRDLVRRVDDPAQPVIAGLAVIAAEVVARAVDGTPGVGVTPCHAPRGPCRTCRSPRSARVAGRRRRGSRSACRCRGRCRAARRRHGR